LGGEDQATCDRSSDNLSAHGAPLLNKAPFSGKQLFTCA
jgi:hypothetical protein